VLTSESKRFSPFSPTALSTFRGLSYYASEIARKPALPRFRFVLAIVRARTTDWRSRALEVAMNTQGEIEAAICERISRFEHEYMGRGPKDIRAYLIADLLVVRLQGVLTAAEQHLVKSLPGERGRDLLKQVRIQLMETARPVLEGLIQEVTGVKALSLHHDVSTVTGEKVVIFTLAAAPLFREAKKK
jgi:uncharacterized protein YbcI